MKKKLLAMVIMMVVLTTSISVFATDTESAETEKTVSFTTVFHMRSTVSDLYEEGDNGMLVMHVYDVFNRQEEYYGIKLLDDTVKEVTDEQALAIEEYWDMRFRGAEEMLYFDKEGFVRRVIITDVFADWWWDNNPDWADIVRQNISNRHKDELLNY